jgi:hypothetical protein
MLRSHGEGDDILFLSEHSVPLAEEIADDLQSHGDRVTVRYYISDNKTTLEKAQTEFTKKLMGDAEAEFGHAYSDITGYLWTDEELQIGGHDLLTELKSAKGKWLNLEIEFVTAQQAEDAGVVK